MTSPIVWSRFERTLIDGTKKKFRIQEVPPDLYQDLWLHLKDNFLRDEPIAFASDFLEDDESVRKSEIFWTKYVYPQNLSLLCVEDKDHDSKPEIVGVNNLMLYEKGNETMEGFHLPDVIHAFFKLLYEDFDVFKHFGVDKYVGACGLSVSRKYRGLNIGLELLKAREHLCKHYGIKHTETGFTSLAAQHLATKAGFHTLYEKSLEEIGRKMGLPKLGHFKKCIVMANVYEF